MTEHRRYHHGDLKQALLDAGDQVLKEKGLQGFTLRECARQAGVSHAAPKHHFGNVTGLLTALAARGFERLSSGLERQLASAGDDLHAQFLAAATAYTQFAERYPEHFRIMFRDDLLDIKSSPELYRMVRATLVTMTNVIRRQRGEEEVTEETMKASLHSRGLIEDILIGWCYIHGYSHLLLENQLDMMPPKIIDELRDNVTTRLSDLIQQGVEPAS